MKATCFVLIAVLVFECTQKNERLPKTIHPTQKTPEVLKKESKGYSMGSLSKKYDTNILDELYREALENNDELKKLDDRIVKILHNNLDSLQTFDRYTQTNNNYWQVVYQYTNRLKDSTLKQSVEKIFQKMEEDYRKNPIFLKSDSIRMKSDVLEDRYLLMKLFITANMIRNYQINELPKSAPLDYLLKEYDRLIKESGKYTQIKR